MNPGYEGMYTGSIDNSFEGVPRGLGLLIPDYPRDDRVFIRPRDKHVRNLYQPGQPLPLDTPNDFYYRFVQYVEKHLIAGS